MILFFRQHKNINIQPTKQKGYMFCKLYSAKIRSKMAIFVGNKNNKNASRFEKLVLRPIKGQKFRRDYPVIVEYRKGGNFSSKLAELNKRLQIFIK